MHGVFKSEGIFPAVIDRKKVVAGLVTVEVGKKVNAIAVSEAKQVSRVLVAVVGGQLRAEREDGEDWLTAFFEEACLEKEQLVAVRRKDARDLQV